MTLEGAVAVLTGADRGLGPLFLSALLRRGAKVHPMSRQPQPTAHRGLWTSRLDVTDPESIAGAAALASDATLVINNEVLSTGTRLVDGDLRDVDLEMEVTFYGALGVIRAFAPVLIANGGGTILDVHAPRDGAAPTPSEAAACAMTETARRELGAQGVRVAALHVDRAALDAVEGGMSRVVARALDDLVGATRNTGVGPGRAAA